MYLDTIEIAPKIAAAFLQDSATIFSQEDSLPKDVKMGYLGYIPWGESNDMPQLIIEKIRKSDVMSPNMFFNILTCYGNGFNVRTADGSDLGEKERSFFRRNNMTKFLFEQVTDIKHFFFSVSLVIMNNEGSEIVRIKHKEAEHARFEVNNPITGRIDHVFFANWVANPKDDEIQVYPVLDGSDPYGDLMVRLGKEPDPETGKTRTATKNRIFAIVTRIPIAGIKYYPFPYYASHFASGWYDISTMIPIAKKAKMTHGMSIKYHVEFHAQYFSKLYEDEGITDQEKKNDRRKLEFKNIKEFLSGIENQGKVWYSGYYIDPNGKENHMVRITVIDNSKDGGDYIEDAEEAANMQCYAMGVHPSLIGAVPGKTKGGFSGSDKRELFTMKQAMEKPFRDLLLIPFTVIQDFNKWAENLIFEIPHLMLTTLDEGQDAKEVIIDNNEDTK